MTNTAKPTANTWTYADYPFRENGFIYAGDPEDGPTVCSDINKTDASLLIDAKSVLDETNLTPRQLLERVRELEAVRDDLNAGIYQLYDYAVNRGNDDDFSLQISILIRQLTEFSFAKHGEGV